MTVTLEQTARAMDELVGAGKRNGKLAYFNAAISALNPVTRNAEQANILKKYANKPLPNNRQDLWQELNGTLFHSHINCLYEIERLWNEGAINFDCGDTFASQSVWRDAMVAKIKGMGMKTISFALHIYNPVDCKLLTIDRHHIDRLGLGHKTLTQKQYKQAEQSLLVVIDELANNEGKGYTVLTYAACLWERWRQAKGLGTSGVYTSHAGLSCYVPAA